MAVDYLVITFSKDVSWRLCENKELSGEDVILSGVPVYGTEPKDLLVIPLSLGMQAFEPVGSVIAGDPSPDESGSG